MLVFCVLNFVFSLVAAFVNVLVIRALWKASSIPDNLKKLFLSLAFTDLAVGMFSQPMLGVIIAVMLNMASNGDYNFVSFCPMILSAFNFCFSLLPCASFLNVTAIAVDRLFAISLHLRYQELVTSKRITVTLVLLWLTSLVIDSVYISLPTGNDIVTAVIVFVGVLLSTVANIRIYKVASYYQNQIQSQFQLQNAQTMELLRQKKSAYNALFVYVVFLACYLPLISTSVILLITDDLRMPFLIADHIALFLAVLNSSLNPLVYCWRYREIRELVKSTVKNIFRMNENGVA